MRHRVRSKHIRPAHETEVDRLLADPTHTARLDAMVARLRTGRPVRWHRLMHDSLRCQLYASPDLASITEMHWRFARAGVKTTIASTWETF
jgi:hypothetical protein